MVVQQPIQHIRRLAEGAGNHLGMKHAVLIGDMGVDRQGLIVIAEVARIERAEERTSLEPEALPIGRRDRPVAPDGTQR